MTKQFTPVDCSRGSPMGRAQYGFGCTPAPRSVRVFKVTLSEGYDDGGAYWGCNSFGAYLYCATDDDGYRMFTRAASRADAIANFKLPTRCLKRG